MTRININMEFTQVARRRAEAFGNLELRFDDIPTPETNDIVVFGEGAGRQLFEVARRYFHFHGEELTITLVLDNPE